MADSLCYRGTTHPKTYCCSQIKDMKSLVLKAHDRELGCRREIASLQHKLADRESSMRALGKQASNLEDARDYNAELVVERDIKLSEATQQADNLKDRVRNAALEEAAMFVEGCGILKPHRDAIARGLRKLVRRML